MQYAKITRWIFLMIIVLGCAEFFVCDVRATELQWTTQLTGSANVDSMAYGNGVFVAITTFAAQYYTSTDGENWVTRTLPASYDWQSITFGNGIFVLISQNEGHIFTSSDGVNWSDAETLGGYYWYNVTYGNNMFVAIEAYMGNVAISTNGTDWTQYTGTIPSGYWQNCTYGNGVFVAADWDGGYAAVSSDGINWVRYMVATVQGFSSIAYGNGVFVTAAYSFSSTSNYVYSSTDGITWTARTMPSSRYWETVSFGNGQFVAIAKNVGVYAVSSNGEDWTEYSMAQAEDWRSAIAYGSNTFAVGAMSGLIMSSVEVVPPSTGGDLNLTATISETITLACGADVDLDSGTPLIPGIPASNTTTCTVTTNDAEGYNLSVADDRAANNALYHATLSATADGQIADKTAWDPTASAGDGNAAAWSGDGLGFSILSSTATKDTTWWGTGSTCADGTQLYAGLPSAATNIMEHTAYSSTSTDTVVCYRVNVPSTQIAGEYSGSITYTATGRP